MDETKNDIKTEDGKVEDTKIETKIDTKIEDNQEDMNLILSKFRYKIKDSKLNNKNEKLWKVCIEIYRRMYKEATPSANFDKLINSDKSNSKSWFMDYYLLMTRQSEIIHEECKKAKLNYRERHKVSKEIYLGVSPNCAKKSEVINYDKI